MTRDELTQMVLAAADYLALAYKRGRGVIRTLSDEKAHVAGPVAPARVIEAATSACSAFDEAEDQYKWLSAFLPQIERDCGEVPRNDALIVLNVFHAMHANSEALRHYGIAAERVDAQLTDGYAMRVNTVHRDELGRSIDELIQRIAGYPGHEGPIDAVMIYAVNNLRASCR